MARSNIPIILDPVGRKCLPRLPLKLRPAIENEKPLVRGAFHSEFLNSKSPVLTFSEISKFTE